MKILALQFRYFGDAVLLTPALRAVKEHLPDSELHVVVAHEVAPVFQHLPWVDRVWAFPRQRGKATLVKSLRTIRDLRRQRFDQAVDFGGNDRGAIVSRLCGAPRRLGPIGPLVPRGFSGRSLCYTDTVLLRPGDHESVRNFQILAPWGITTQEAPRLEIRPDPAKAAAAAGLLPRPAIVCHLATSQPRKEWPLSHWAELHRRASAAGYEVVFSSGIVSREAALLDEIRGLVPSAATLPSLPDLATFLAVVSRARLFISGDTGALHCAAALGVPTISLFGPSPARLWAPFGQQHRHIEVADCPCRFDDNFLCVSATPCMTTISPQAVLDLASGMLREAPAPRYASS